MDDDSQRTSGFQEADEQGAAREMTEERFAVNARMIREGLGMSQITMAEEMRARGWSWRQQTVHRIERQQRLVRLGEAKDVAEILGTSLDRLTQPTAEMREVELLSEWIRQAKVAWRQIVVATAQLLNARGLLRTYPAVVAEELPPAINVAEAVLEARTMQELTPEGAVTQGIAQLARSGEFLAQGAGEDGTTTIRPENYANSTEAIVRALRRGEVIVIDFAGAPSQVVERIQDFANGAVRVRGGDVQIIAPGRYRLVPAILNAREMVLSAPDASDKGAEHAPGGP